MTQAVDLEALKRDLEADGYLVISNGHSLYVATQTLERLTPHCRVYPDGDVRWREERRGAPLRDIIARHVRPQPSPDRAAAMERIAITLYQGQGRAEPWEQLRDDIKDHWFRFADTGLTAVEAEGWGPRPAAVTEDELDEMRDAAWMSARTDGAMWKAVVDAVLVALPDRHRAIVLGSRGITVEGAK